MESKIFKATNGLELVIKSKRSAVIFEAVQGQEENEGNEFVFRFTSQIWNNLTKYIETISNKCWNGLKPREVYSLESDYYEYYDKKLDNNGYLTVKENTLIIERPVPESIRLYQFNKKKMESFIYDFKKITKSN